MAGKFFDDFQASTKKDWEVQATKDLKGKNFAETLVWKTFEGLAVQPYYAEEDLAGVPLNEIQQAQLMRKYRGWQNRPEVRFSDEKNTNELIAGTLQNGAQAIEINFDGVDIRDIDFSRLLDKVKLSDTPVYFKTDKNEALLAALKRFIHYRPKGGLILDSLGGMFGGRGIIDDSTWKNAKSLIQDCADYPSFYVLNVGSGVFHNAGANSVQELAFTLATAVTYLDKLTDLGLSAGQVAAKIEFSIAIGTNYFMEIAKLRALRYLWSRIVEAYQCAETDCRIHAHTSYFYDAAADAHTNMLRATTEAMSAVIGGCDSLNIHGYDAVFNAKPNEMSERIARNVSVLLSDESYMGKTQDAAAGSYYIENLTNDLSTAAWNLFLVVEQKGGILQAFEEEFIQEEIEKAYQEKVKQLESGKIMVGVNKFRAPDEVPPKAPVQPSIDKHYLPKRRISAIFE